MHIYSILALALLIFAARAFTTDYAVVVSHTTATNADWKPVVDALRDKHAAQVLIFGDSVEESLGPLRESFPRYACFVAQSQEAGRDFVAAVHRLTRKLDNDPYTDCFWGILTGYDSVNALRIATEKEPLVIRKVAAGTEFALDRCEEGFWYDELVKNKFVRKEKGGLATQLAGPDDTTAALVSALNDNRADLFITSGHATERDWQIGFRYRNGYFRCTNGTLYGQDTTGRKYPIQSRNPKVFMPVGNCLMGHIDSLEAMALAWMNSAGVNQMIGYTVLTWYGYAGWGCLDYFVEQPGRYTFCEAFLANHHALIHRQFSAGLSPQDARGLQHDRDTLAFYGDPAWIARMAPGPLAWDQSLIEKEGVWTFSITPNRGEKTFEPVNRNGSQRGYRPIIQFLPRRLKNVQLLTGADLQPVLTDDFILIPNPKTCDPTRSYQLTFRSED